MSNLIPLVNQHPAYSTYLRKWSRCRDAAEGSDAVKDAGEKYLPRLTGQSDADYRAYKERGLYVNVTGRTLNSLTGLITNRQPELIIPPRMEEHFHDTDNRGTEFPQLLRWCINDVLLVGRLGLLVDFPADGGRGYVNAYAAENIVNWGIDNNTYKLNMVCLEEHLYEPVSFPVAGTNGLQIGMQAFTRIRVLFIDNDGFYRVHTFRHKPVPSGSSIISLELEQDIRPTIGDRRIDYIPFTFITPFGIDSAVYKPPMLDIADVNLSHYRSSVDLEHGRHYTALPVPIVSGIETDKELRLGSQTAWILPAADAKAYFLEFKGEGLKSLEQALKEKMEQMALFSTRLMDTSTRGSESPDSVRIRQSSDAATLVDIARAVETGLNRAYTTLCDLEGIEEEVKVSLNKNFLSVKLTAAELKELTAAYLEGAIDEATYLYNLQKGDIKPPKGELNGS